MSHLKRVRKLFWSGVSRVYYRWHSFIIGKAQRPRDFIARILLFIVNWISPETIYHLTDVHLSDIHWNMSDWAHDIDNIDSTSFTYKFADARIQWYYARLSLLKHDMDKLFTPWMVDMSNDYYRAFMESETEKSNWSHFADKLWPPPPSKKLWRTLISVDEIVNNEVESYVRFRIPGWSGTKTVRRFEEELPKSVWKQIVKGQIHFHAKVNIGAEEERDLTIKNWELA